MSTPATVICVARTMAAAAPQAASASHSRFIRASGAGTLPMAAMLMRPMPIAAMPIAAMPIAPSAALLMGPIPMAGMPSGTAHGGNDHGGIAHGANAHRNSMMYMYRLP